MQLTDQARRVLEAFLADADAPRYGYDLMRATRLKSGTLYPLLTRLETQGLVHARWEDQPQPGRPPRRYYQLTGEGVRVARQARAEASFAGPARGRNAHGGPIPGGQPA